MPLPKPKENEREQDFIDRCMSNNTMKKEFKDNDQRVAVCYSQFERKEETKMKNFKELIQKWAERI